MQTTSARSHRRGLAVTLVLLVTLPGCLSALEGSQPEHPERLDYLLRANDSRKAPHPISFDGAFAELGIEGPARTLEVAGVAHATSRVERVQMEIPSSPAGPGPSPGPDPPPEHSVDEASRGPMGLPGERLTLAGASGVFHPDNGTSRNLSDAGVVIELPRSGELAVPNLTHVEAREWVFRDGRAQAQAPPGPIPTLVPVNVTGNGTHGEVEEGPPQAPATHPRLTIGPDGTRIRAASISILGPADWPGGGDGANESEFSPFPGRGEPGVLQLDPGTVAVGGARLGFAPAEPVELPASSQLRRVSIQAPTTPLVLYGEERAIDRVRLDTEAASGTIDVEGSRAQLSLAADQWHEDGRPWFEARIEATFDAGGTSTRVEVAPGENETVWAAVEETGQVGTAERVEPNVLEPRPDEDTLTLTPGLSWYDSPDPSAIDEITSALATLITGWFVDPDEVTIEPGGTMYIPLVVHAAEGASAGTHTVQLDFKGDNARSDPITVEVAITSA